MPEIKILLTRVFPPIAADLLRKEGFHVTQWPMDRPMTPEELVTEAKTNDALLCHVADKIDAVFLKECSHLGIISQFAVGYDNINIEEATKLGIPVGNTPGVLTDATADIAFALMLAVSRKMFYLHKTIQDGGWKYFHPTRNLGIELKNKTLGIFGLGRIGLEMAKRSKGAYGMNIIYCNRKSNPGAEKILSASLVSFDDLLSQSDVLSVHSALTDQTRGIFNASAFSKMKRSAIFINTSRGPVHNEPDLIAALQSGHIWGAGLDVTNPEPMSPDSPLLTMENVAVLPHVASGTVEARTEMARLAAVNIVEFYRTGVVPHLVNPDYPMFSQ